MRLHRIYYPFNANLGDHVLIENEKSHYIGNVLRLKVGRQFKIFNHEMVEYIAEIIAVNKKNIEIKMIETINAIASSKLQITLIQGLSKGERMDYTVQKATELGIITIIPIISEYCEVKLTGQRLDKKLNHWKNIAISACEQSFRADIPNIITPISISEYCKTHHLGLLLEPEETTTIKQVAKENWQNLTLLLAQKVAGRKLT
ncbi:MAG: 16S rRNA (uracil(1498)-N(3))-methyltransferase [Alcanivoracaceae bacterium]|nr:16S rRNA (uracil(1498)-N(3))-methyltransferase [Alcanivoracaceae bacterium]